MIERTDNNLGGVLPVIATPFDAAFRVDAQALEDEIDWLFAAGANGVVVAMVSELQRLSCDERKQIGSTVVGITHGRGPVILSVGAESTESAVTFAQEAKSAGAQAIMANPPLTTIASDPELLDYYESIIQATDLPLVVQDASGYVGKPLTMELQAELYRRHGGERILFKPEAVPIGPRITALRAVTGAEVKIFDGSGGVALVDSYRRGLAGTMPGADLIWAVKALWEALKAGDEQRVYEVSGALSPVLSLMSDLDSYVAIEKYLLVQQGVFGSARQRGPTSYRMDKMTQLEADRSLARLRVAVDGYSR